MNYEVDVYVESQKRLPSKEVTLETTEGTYYFFKADILKGLITYSTDKNLMANAVTITARNAFEIINMNKRGEKPENLIDVNSNASQKTFDLVEQESLTRFDKRKGNNTNRKKKKKTVTPNRESHREDSRPNISEKENKPQNNEPKMKEHAPIAEKGKEGDNRKTDKGRNKYHNNRKPNGPREKRTENPSENPVKKGANEKTQPQN